MSVSDWTDYENDLIVADYFAMLTEELAGQSYNKAEHNRQLQRILPSRSEGSIEFKHQNISAVLIGLGQQWIVGYKPAARFQGSLVDAVLRWLGATPSWTNIDHRRTYGTPIGEQDNPLLWIGPPPSHSNQPPPIDTEFMSAIARKYDVAERDARNRDLGRAGEERVLHHERSMLRAAGRSDLAERICWTAKEEGDGAGYDIHSFELDGQNRLLEVKTTNGWDRTPFHITRNELRVAEENRNTWHLIRVWNFAREPKAFSIRPPLEAHVSLTPTSFLASLN